MSYAEAQYTVDEVINGLRQTPPPLGIEPNNLKNLKIIGGDQHIYIHFEPLDTIIDGQVLTTVGKIIIRRKIGDYPINENDGDLVAELTGDDMFKYSTQPYMDEGLVNGTEYFYRLFPVSNYGIVNRSMANAAKATPYKSDIWGFHQDFTNLDPATTITYLENTNNADFTPMNTNAVSTSYTGSSYVAPSLGSWENWVWLKQNKPCIIDRSTKKMLAQLRTNLSTADTFTPAKIIDTDGVEHSSYNKEGEWFAWFPKIYMKEVYAPDGNSRDVYFAMHREGDTADFIPVGFINQDNQELEGVWIPMYYPMNEGGKVYPNYTGVTHMIPTQLSETIGGGAVLGGPIMHVIRDLLYMLYKTTYLEPVSGYGFLISSKVSYAQQNYTNHAQFRGFNESSSWTASAFWSNVILSYGFLLNDPYSLQSGSYLYMSPNYKYSQASSLDKSIYTDTKTSWGTSGTIWPTLLTYYGDGLGSGPKYSTPFGSATTGLCDTCGFTASEFKMLARLGKWGGGTTRYTYGQAHFSTIYSPSAASGNTANACIFAPMALPEPGYKPEFVEEV